MFAAMNGHVDATRLLLDHPSADAAAMMMLANSSKDTALLIAAWKGDVDTMRLLLDHPSADAAAMMILKQHDGCDALMLAAQEGHVDALRLLLDHPSADVAAMMATRSAEGISAVMAAAGFAACQPTDRYRDTRSCAPLLLLLRRDAVELQPSDAQEAHMTKVMEVLCQEVEEEEEEEERVKLFVDDHPNDARDECIRLLLERGAAIFDATLPPACRPVLSRIIREHAQLARVPQLLNEAVLGVAIARQPDQKQQHNAP
ncbi:hypothetical protein FOA52_001413 [Chlamydomonas sp. UWO 241]|nr:hypothetical protein FOA52_001413 [Chlamydomonas sp. UWO 241]